MLKLITPHLRAAFNNSRAFERIENERRYLETAVSRGIAVIGADLDVIFINDMADKLLRDYFGSHRG